MNVNDPQRWLTLKPDSVVTLKDEQSLLQDINGVECLIKRVIRLPECQKLCTWILFQLDHPGKEPFWLMVKIVGYNLDFRLYVMPLDFERGNRKDLIEGGEQGHWVFQEPDEGCFQYVDEDDEELEEPFLILNNLVFTDSFEFDGVEYKKKAQGDFACGDFDGGNPVVELPKVEGIEFSQLATLAEYISDDNREALIFEIGDADDDDGGLISLLVGRTIQTNDLEILAK